MASSSRRARPGYRLYDDTALDRLVAMSRLVRAGWSPRQAAERIREQGIDTNADGTAPNDALDGGWLGSWMEAVTSLDASRIERLLDDLFASGSFERVVDERLMPALREVGDGWAAGTVSVAAEHAASHAVLRRLSSAFEAAEPARLTANGRRPCAGEPPRARCVGLRRGRPTPRHRDDLPREPTYRARAGPRRSARTWCQSNRRIGSPHQPTGRRRRTSPVR